MQTEPKIKWLDALRSGKYQQGRRFYKAQNKFCVVGVLLNELDHTGWESYNKDTFFWHPSATKLLTNAGLTEDNLAELYTMNDHEDKDFSEIADWIEQKLCWIEQQP